MTTKQISEQTSKSDHTNLRTVHLGTGIELIKNENILNTVGTCIAYIKVNFFPHGCYSSYFKPVVPHALVKMSLHSGMFTQNLPLQP